MGCDFCYAPTSRGESLMSMVLIITMVPAVFIVLLGIFMAEFRIWKPKRTFYFVITYALCGLVAFTYLLIASKDMDQAQSKDVIVQQLAENEEMTERLKMRDFTVLKQEQLQFTEMFEPSAEDVTVNRDGELRHIHTVINWVDTPENTITASYYETPIYIKRVYMTPYVKAPEITFENNTIFIKDKESRITRKTINMSLEMLNDERWNDRTDEFVGNRILYLNVPKQFNIIDSGGWY